LKINYYNRLQEIAWCATMVKSKICYLNNLLSQFYIENNILDKSNSIISIIPENLFYSEY